MAQARANMGGNDMQSYEARQARERVRTAASASKALKNQIVRAHQLLNNPVRKSRCERNMEEERGVGHGDGWIVIIMDVIMM